MEQSHRGTFFSHPRSSSRRIFSTSSSSIGVEIRKIIFYGAKIAFEEEIARNLDKDGEMFYLYDEL